MDCPVCNYRGIVPTTTNCPNCRSNLASIKAVNTLAKKHAGLEETTTGLTKKLELQKDDYEARLSRKNRIIWGIFLGTMAILLVALFFGLKHFKEKEAIVKKQEATLKTYQSNLSEQETANQELSTKLAALEQARSIRELKYTIKKGDVLHQLGELFYNDPDAGIQIALDNKIYDIRGLPIGETITIKYRD